MVFRCSAFSRYLAGRDHSKKTLVLLSEYAGYGWHVGPVKAPKPRAGRHWFPLRHTKVLLMGLQYENASPTP